MLLDDASPGWTRTLTPKDDLALLLMSSSRTQPSRDVDGAAARYDGPALRRAEEKRDADQKVRVADERHRYAEGPVLVVPAGRNASFLTAGITPIPGLGTVYPTYRVSGEWGSLEAERVLLSTDKTTLTLAAPVSTEGAVLTGDGWKVTMAAGWVVRPGARAGELVLVRATSR